MRTFLKWVEENKLDLPSLNNTDAGTSTTDEAGSVARRYRFGHPDAEAASQYPDGYFAARMPDFFVQKQWRKKQTSKAAPENTPG